MEVESVAQNQYHKRGSSKWVILLRANHNKKNILRLQNFLDLLIKSLYLRYSRMLTTFWMHKTRLWIILKRSVICSKSLIRKVNDYLADASTLQKNQESCKSLRRLDEAKIFKILLMIKNKIQHTIPKI